MGRKIDPAVLMTVDALVERFVGQPPFASAFATAMSRSLTPAEQLDVVIVMRETRTECLRHAEELDELRARLDVAGANHDLIARATAAYSSQFIVGETTGADLATPSEQAALRVHAWIDNEPQPRLTMEALVKRFEKDNAFAMLMSAPLSGQERGDIVLVTRHVRARRHRHQPDLENLGHALRESGANECAVYRIAALYSAQFPLTDEIAYDAAPPAKDAALRIWTWVSKPSSGHGVQMLSALIQSQMPEQSRGRTRGLMA